MPSSEKNQAPRQLSLHNNNHIIIHMGLQKFPRFQLEEADDGRGMPKTLMHFGNLISYFEKILSFTLHSETWMKSLPDGSSRVNPSLQTIVTIKMPILVLWSKMLLRQYMSGHERAARAKATARSAKTKRSNRKRVGFHGYYDNAVSSST